MKIKGKYIIAGALGVISIALALGYLQYKKLMNYTLGFKGIKLNKASATELNFDLFLNFVNKSNLKFDVIEQDYSIYINDVFLTKAVNYSTNTVLPSSASVMGVNINFNPAQAYKNLKGGFATMLLSPQMLKLKIDIKLKVKLYGIKISIPIVHETTLKEILTPVPTA
jgi:LEA14-like dessication related protein